VVPYYENYQRVVERRERCAVRWRVSCWLYYEPGWVFEMPYAAFLRVVVINLLRAPYPAPNKS
jgi:hypothetical protein